RRLGHREFEAAYRGVSCRLARGRRGGRRLSVIARGEHRQACRKRGYMERPDTVHRDVLLFLCRCDRALRGAYLNRPDAVRERRQVPWCAVAPINPPTVSALREFREHVVSAL